MKNKEFFWSKLIHPLSRLFKKRTEIVILFTSDVHGSIYPYDYILGKKTEWGLAKIATIVEQYRKTYKNLLLLDNGDFLQGSPLNYYFNYINRKMPYPLALVMNFMRYDASCVGNHDIEQGPRVYNRVRKQLKFPWLCANAITSKGKSYFQPFTMREFEGIKVAILGLTTPAIPLWVNPETYRGIRWQDMEEAARGWVSFLKEKKQADVLIGLFHAGIQPSANKPDWPKDIPEENPCLEIARQNHQYDVIITGHQHRKYNSHPEYHTNRSLNTPLIVMAGSHARYLGVVYLSFRRKNNVWQLIDKFAQIKPVKGVPPQQEVLKIYQPYHERVMKYINSKIGEALEDISSRNARLQDNAFVDLIHKAQLSHTRADISFAAAFTTRYTLKKGPIRIKDVYGLYQYENNLYVILMSGRQIKEHLEQSSAYFNQIDPADPFRIPLINRDFMGFNFDMAEGINYEIDITLPVGRRVINIRDSRTGEAFDLERTYKVSVNSYRAIQLQKKYGCRVIWKSSKEMRDILVEYIRKVKKVGDDFSANWRLVPEDLVEKILRHSRIHSN